MGIKRSSLYSLATNVGFFSLVLSILYDAYSVHNNSKTLNKSIIQTEFNTINTKGNMGLKSSLVDLVERGVEISGADLSNGFLTGISIPHAHGENVNWAGAKMQRSTITHAKLYQSNFSNAELTGATLHCFNKNDEYCDGPRIKLNVKPDFHIVDPFEDEKPSIVTEEDGSFRVLFNSANLKYCIMSHGDFSNDDFSDADLSHANLRNSDFSSAIFNNAHLDNADISGSNFTNTIGLTQKMVDTACYSKNNKPTLPKGINLSYKNCLNSIPGNLL